MGIYKKYDYNGTILIEGNYNANLKDGRWYCYKEMGYDIIFQQFNKDKKYGLWEYVIKDKLVRGEMFSKDGNMQFYFVSTYDGDFETREYFKNGRKYNIVKFKNGAIIEDITID